jgi:pimeloyl-ACP methyl ester carboxylesterase
MPALAGVEHDFHRLSTGVRVHVATAGAPQAPPVLALHGWPQHWWAWRRVIPLLGRKFRVIVPDLRGLGWSSPAPDGDYRKERLAEDAVALLDALGIERAGLLGHDWGGWVGFLACLNHPDRIERFIALGIAHPYPQLRPRSVLWPLRLAYQVPLAAPVLGRLLADHVPGFAGLVIRLAAVRTDAFDARDFEVYDATLRGSTTVATYRSFLLRDLPQVIRGRYRRRHEVPTRLAVGERDLVVSENELGGYEKWADDMDTEVIRGAGHFIPVEAPDDVIRLARSFLRPARPRAAPATSGSRGSRGTRPRA